VDHFENKHCVDTQYYERYHYKSDTEGNIAACGVRDNPTEVELRGKSKGYPTFRFEIPRQKHELQKLEEMLQHAYLRGISDNRAQIGEMMRALIAL